MKARCGECNAFVTPGSACKACGRREAGTDGKPSGRKAMMKARWAVSKRLEAATSAVTRARLTILLASHDERLAEVGGDRPRRRKYCPSCERYIGLDDAAWSREFGGKRWHRICRLCQEKVHLGLAVAPAPVPPPAVVPAPPARVPKGRHPAGNSAERHEAASRRYDEEQIRPLVRRYEAVRATPGPDRDRAVRRLELALSRHGSPISCDGWVYRWYREEQSITRKRAAGHHRPGPVMATETIA